MIIILVALLVTFTKQAEGNQYPLLKIDFFSNSQREYNVLAKLIKSSSSGQFISIKLITCQQKDPCPNFELYDPYGTLLEEYGGTASSTRYMDIINKYLNLNNYPINQFNHLQRLKDEDFSLKIFQQRRKLAQLQKSEDWQKATQQPRKKSPPHHKPAKQSREKGQDLHKAKKNNLKNENTDDSQSKNEETTTLETQATKTTLETPTKTASRYQAVEHLFAWKIAFVCLTIGLLIGMKYLKQQEERIDKIHQEGKNEPQNQYDENDSLNQL